MKPRRPSKTRTLRIRVLIGIAIWVLLAGTGWNWLRLGTGRQAAERSLQQIVGGLDEVEVRFPESVALEPGARLRVARGEFLAPAGRVVAVERRDEALIARIALYPESHDRLRPGAEFVAYETAGDIAWILQTLFPERVRDEIRDMLLRRWRLERDVLMKELRPGMARLADDLGRALRDDFQRVYRDHREEFTAMGTVLRERGWEDNLEASFRDEIWPLVETRATPLVAEIGDELIEAFPLFDFSWSYLLQKIDFSKERRVQKELRRFVDEKGIPILRSHEAEFRAAAVAVLKDAVAKGTTRRALENAVFDVAHDPRFVEALGTVLEAWLLNNEEVQGILNGLWDRDDLRRPLDRFFDRLTPEIHRLANRIILDDTGKGIDPELARVLRRKLLREDERWVLLRPGADEARPHDGGAWPGVDGGIR